jgi:hypothetical protein
MFIQFSVSQNVLQIIQNPVYCGTYMYVFSTLSKTTTFKACPVKKKNLLPHLYRGFILTKKEVLTPQKTPGTPFGPLDGGSRFLGFSKA